ncbi:hypothetical protein TWF718_011197 [Orbilia javanica]|uniref:Uncharacterized protein n=1 Tax=Orbilia javanica TaxID=47235 RepID=A0AAN8ML25_9PEZI
MFVLKLQKPSGIRLLLTRGFSMQYTTSGIERSIMWPGTPNSSHRFQKLQQTVSTGPFTLPHDLPSRSSPRRPGHHGLILAFISNLLAICCTAVAFPPYILSMASSEHKIAVEAVAPGYSDDHSFRDLRSWP